MGGCFVMVFPMKNIVDDTGVDEFYEKRNKSIAEDSPSRKGHYLLFTDTVRDDLLNGVRDGLGESANIRNAGILPSTFYKWRRDARENWESNPDHVMVKFFKEYDKERAKHQRKLLMYIDPMSNPKLAMQLLEKYYKDDFGKTETVEHTGEVTANVSMQEKRDRLARIMQNENQEDDE